MCLGMDYKNGCVKLNLSSLCFPKTKVKTREYDVFTFEINQPTSWVRFLEALFGGYSSVIDQHISVWSLAGMLLSPELSRVRGEGGSECSPKEERGGCGLWLSFIYWEGNVQTTHNNNIIITSMSVNQQTGWCVCVRVCVSTYGADGIYYPKCSFPKQLFFFFFLLQ